MQEPKLHQLKPFLTHLQGHTRVLLLGPLPIRDSVLKKTIKSIDPTLILLIDGGEKHKKKLTKSRQKCTLSLGDGDSSARTSRPSILLNTDKDFSDLTFALYGMQKAKIRWESVGLLGFSNVIEDRPDHFLFNLGSVYNFVKKNPLTIMLDERFLFLPEGENSFNCKGLFSVISLEKTQLKLSGKARYQLPTWTTIDVLSSHGLSNQGRGMIKIAGKKPLIIYLAGTKTSS